MSGQGNFHHQEQNANYDDGKTSYQYHSTQTTHTSTTTGIPGNAFLAAAGPAHPFGQQPLLQTPVQQALPAANRGQQLQQQALTHHQQALQHHHAVARNVQQPSGGTHRNPMLQIAAPTSFVPPSPGPCPVQQIPWATLPAPSYQQPGQYLIAPAQSRPQQQLQYAPQLAPIRQPQQYQQNIDAPCPARAAQLPIEAPRSEFSESECSSDEDDEEADRLADIEQRQRQISVFMQKEGRKAMDAIRRLEDSHTHSQQEREAKDKQLEVLQQQIADLHRQLQPQQAQAQAAAAQPHQPPVDVSALRRMIQEDIQRQHLDLDDVKNLIKTEVGQEMADVARSSHLDAAAKNMEKVLKNMAYASDDRVRRTVQEQLDKAVKDVVGRLPKQQTMLEAPGIPQQMPWQQMHQTPMVQHLVGVEQLPDDHPGLSSPPLRSLPALPPASPVHKFTPLTNDALTQLGKHNDGAGAGSSDRKRSKSSRVSVQPSPDNAVSRVKSSRATVLPIAEDQSRGHLTESALAHLSVNDDSKVGDACKSRHSKSRMSIQPSDANALARVSSSDTRKRGSASRTSGTEAPHSSNAPDRLKTSEVKASGGSRLSTVSTASANSGRTYRSSAEAMQAVQAASTDLVRQSRRGAGDGAATTGELTALTRRPAEIDLTALADQGTVSRTRPRNDRRDELEAVKEEESNALVRVSKEVARKKT